MIKIAITEAAFEAIARMLPLGSVGFENEVNERGEHLIWLEDAASVIGTRSDAQSRPIFYSLPRRRCCARHGVDRPASRHAGLRSCFHVLPSAAWKRGHAQANDRQSSRVFAMPPRGFARTTRNG